MIQLFTIGFTEKSAERFFDLLAGNGVTCITDTRVNTTGQLSGFAKGSDLAFFARTIGNMQYAHHLDLAPTRELLARYRAKELSWEAYETEYLLANSKKYGGRCLAGIEVERDEAGALHVTRTAHHLPAWIRPVSRTPYGEMPEKLVRHLQLCDLVSFDMDFACPQEFQRENVFYTANRFEKTGNLNLKAHNLAQLTDTREGLLGNLRKSLTPAEAAGLDHSIVLIRTQPSAMRFYEIGATHLRTVFPYQDATFDLPVTDIDFYLKWIDVPDLLSPATDVFLCVSLSREKDGFYYKLVAGVLVV